VAIPKDQPLLETTAVASDRVVAWIAPNTTAKVVCIQPGDATTTHRNPAAERNFMGGWPFNLKGLLSVRGI